MDEKGIESNAHFSASSVLLLVEKFKNPGILFTTSVNLLTFKVLCLLL